MYIDTLEGVRYDLNQYGLKPLKFEIDSLSSRTESEVIDGRDGHIDIETTFEGRSLRASFLLEAKNIIDFSFLRDKVFRLFDGKTYFYILESRQPSKRWKVRTVSKFTLDRINPRTATFEISFLSPSPYAESIGSTLYPYYLDGYLQVSTHENVQYIFQENVFSVWNDGDVAVDPREYPLRIEFKGASNNLTIRNLTTNDEWQYNGTTNSNDIITLDGIRSFKNGFSIFGKTNRKLITLNQGWNDFEIVGALDPYEISFDFRFYYI
ncbi:phage tail family protein [Bacillus methanolicus]|nr:phage tail family protein [Bacillus methanolicus]